VVTDFGADCSFAQAVEKVSEHYGIEVSVSTVRLIAEGQGAVLEEESGVEAHLPAKGVPCLIAESDGSPVPCVEFGEGAGDRRKRRILCWHEAKSGLARVKGSTQPRYAATMKQIGEAGLRWRTAAIDAGAGRHTHLHCLGDGAKAIARQVTEQFGSQATYLLDFYHASEYLAEAAERIAGGGQQARLWLRAKQEQLRDHRAAEVIAELFKEREAEDLAEEASPVRRSYRYLSERREYLDYKGAIEAGLPIGSGEIEGGHRSVVQARLKKSGAWWKTENAEKMLSLRVCRANGEWSSYWQQIRQAAA
jgi:hypothetical protein